MPKYENKERDDALIAEKKRVAKELERMAETSRYATMGEQTSLAEAIVLLRGDEQSAPKPDRAEVLAGEVISAANIVSHGGYYELDEEAVTTIIRRHFDELRAEIEAERPAVVVPMSAKMWAESVLNLRGAINATCEREAARFILSLDGAKGDE